MARRALITADPASLEADRLVRVFARTPLHVLVLGETGTGKEVFAEALHARSQRSDRPLVKLNCAALPCALAESELFGYERGAFTGADRAKPGLIEAADGGTLLLDELGELPLELQAKLLRVVEAGEVLRVGALQPRPVDVRCIGVTSVDLERAAIDGRFRPDLLYRLNSFTLRIAPLRDRTGDVLALARHFAGDFAERTAIGPLPLRESAEAALLGYAFPGNVRELKNVVERATVIALPEGAIEACHLGLPAGPSLPRHRSPPSASLRARVSAFERDRIVDALHTTGGNQTQAARLLGISRRALIQRIIAHRIPRPRVPSARPPGQVQ